MSREKETKQNKNKTIMPTNDETTSAPPAPTSAPATTRLVDVSITNQNDALQLMVSFLNLAQRRGVFTIDEAAKIWECVKFFQ